MSSYCAKLNTFSFLPPRRASSAPAWLPVLRARWLRLLHHGIPGKLVVYVLQRAKRVKPFPQPGSSTWGFLPWHSAATSWTCATEPAGQTRTTVTQSSACASAASAKTSIRVWALLQRSKVGSDVLPFTLWLRNLPAREKKQYLKWETV